jgi:hypothetical protein
LLHRSIVRRDDGTYILTTGRDHVSLVVTDTPFFVRTFERADSGAVAVVLSDDTREMLVDDTEIVVDEYDRMRMRVKGDRFWAKLLRPAHAAIVDTISLAGDVTLARPLGAAPVRIAESAGDIDWKR